MQQKPSLELPTPPTAAPQIPSDDPTSSSIFDWSDFLDFNLDETLNIPFPQPGPEQTVIDQSQQPESPDQETPGLVRKRDPRLVCSNFLAGRIPCACPELDKLAEEEESGLPGKKRTRVARTSGGAPLRCQVPGCEVDIGELKGYHKRHRVCLECVNASAVVLDGESKRYCQQCGKFHILSDFDEGKRSCRRKLERHNNRRRRKPSDSKEGAEKESQQITLADDRSGEDDTAKGSIEGMEKESQQIVLTDDLCGDDDTGKDGIDMSSQVEERGTLLESDGQVSRLCSVLGSQNLQSDSDTSFAGSGRNHIEGDKQNPNSNILRPTVITRCPAGRISFKLYDWNPAEFPRRLRLQIFQWLASMPVELEGYIRPGCTILTAFIAMPKPVWHKLLEEPALCIKNLVKSPGSLLSGRGTMHVFLNDMIFRVTKDATSVLRVKVKDQAPKLHYIYPTCFEAGKPMEFVACGSYLLQPDFRFLLSFAGRYLPYGISVSSLSGEKGDANCSDYQLLKINVPQIDISLSGPAFVEVENQSGLSNFIPILVGDKETCAEMEVLQQKFDTSLPSREQKVYHPQPACEFFASRQAQFSEFVLDVAWLLKKPVSEQQLTSSHIQRSNYLLDFLMEKESSVILERILCSLRSAIDNNLAVGKSDSDLRLLRKSMDTAGQSLAQRIPEKEFMSMAAPNGDSYSYSSKNDNISVPAANQGLQRMLKNLLGLSLQSSSSHDDPTVPLLKREVIMNVDLQEKPRKSSSRSLTRTFFSSRPLIITIMTICVCFGVCAAVVHPQRISHIATTIHRCLFDNS